MMVMMVMMVMMMLIIITTAFIQHTVAARDFVMIMRAIASLCTREQEKGRTTGTVDLGGTLDDDDDSNDHRNHIVIVNIIFIIFNIIINHHLWLGGTGALSRASGRGRDGDESELKSPSW